MSSFKKIVAFLAFVLALAQGSPVAGRHPVVEPSVVARTVEYDPVPVTCTEAFSYSMHNTYTDETLSSLPVFGTHTHHPDSLSTGHPVSTDDAFTRTTLSPFTWPSTWTHVPHPTHAAGRPISRPNMITSSGDLPQPSDEPQTFTFETFPVSGSMSGTSFVTLTQTSHEPQTWTFATQTEPAFSTATPLPNTFTFETFPVSGSMSGTSFVTLTQSSQVPATWTFATQTEPAFSTATSLPYPENPLSTGTRPFGTRPFGLPSHGSHTQTWASSATLSLRDEVATEVEPPSRITHRPTKPTFTLPRHTHTLHRSSANVAREEAATVDVRPPFRPTHGPAKPTFTIPHYSHTFVQPSAVVARDEEAVESWPHFTHPRPTFTLPHRSHTLNRPSTLATVTAVPSSAEHDPHQGHPYIGPAATAVVEA